MVVSGYLSLVLVGVDLVLLFKRNMLFLGSWFVTPTYSDIEEHPTLTVKFIVVTETAHTPPHQILTYALAPALPPSKAAF